MDLTFCLLKLLYVMSVLTVTVCDIQFVFDLSNWSEWRGVLASQWNGAAQTKATALDQKI